MNTDALLTHLRNCGIRVEARPSGNLYLAPKDRLTTKLLEQVGAHKAELLAALKAGQGAPPTELAPAVEHPENGPSPLVAPVRDVMPAAVASKPARPAVATITPDSRHPLIAPEVRAKIEAIEVEARRLGWPPELLWNAHYWHSPRGLAAVLDADDEIVEVTADAIKVLKLHRDLQVFRRHVGQAIAQPGTERIGTA